MPIETKNRQAWSLTVILSFFNSSFALLSNSSGVSNLSSSRVSSLSSGGVNLNSSGVLYGSRSSSFVTTRCERDSCNSYEH